LEALPVIAAASNSQPLDLQQLQQLMQAQMQQWQGLQLQGGVATAQQQEKYQQLLLRQQQQQQLVAMASQQGVYHMQQQQLLLPDRAAPAQHFVHFQHAHTPAQQQQLVLAVAVDPQYLQAATQPAAEGTAGAAVLAPARAEQTAAAAAAEGVLGVRAADALQQGGGADAGVASASSQQQVLQVIGQLRQHSTCVAGQLQQLVMLWPAAGEAVVQPDSSDAAAGAVATAAGAEVALPHDLQQLLQLCLQQQVAVDLQLLSMEQLVHHTTAQQHSAMLGSSSAEGVGTAAGPQAAAASLAVSYAKLQQQHSQVCELLQSLSDCVGQRTVGVAAAVPATAAALSVPPNAAAADVVDAAGVGFASALESRAQWIGAVRDVLSTAVQHLLRAMRLLGFEGA
jgi:hypothetical protein